MSTSPRKILVVGATGKQGRALIAALRPNAESGEEAPFQILAFTRSAASPAANYLADKEPHVTIVEGDLDNEESVRKVFEDAGRKGGIYGVFVVLAFPGLNANADHTERHGKRMADLSLEYEVSHYIYSSAERGGESWDEDTTLNRRAQVMIERHVKSLTEKGLRWTLVRPAFFVDNYDGTIGKVTVAVLRGGLKADTKMQLVVVKDIGGVAAAAFKNTDSVIHKILTVTSDILTISEQDAAYKRATGKSMPSIPGILGRGILAMNSATKEVVSDLERVHQARQEDPAGYEAHLADARALYPNMTSFEQWASERKDAKDDGSDINWNGVSLTKLMTGKH